MDWKSGRVLLKQMTNKMSMGGSNSPLYEALQKENYTKNLAGRFSAMKKSGKFFK